jgi:Domain of unknown function (DUF4166)
LHDPSSMQSINEFSLQIHSGPYEKWPTKSFLYRHGEATKTRLAGYTLLHQFALNEHYLLISDFDCPFEEATVFSLLDQALKIVATRTFSAPYSSWFLTKLELADSTRLIAYFGEEEVWEIEARKPNWQWAWARLPARKKATLRNETEQPIFARILAKDFASLPPPIQQMHDDRDEKLFTGHCDIEHDQGFLGSLIRKIARLPSAGNNIPLTVKINRHGNSEVWRRQFANQTMTSQLWCDGILLRERLGPATLHFQLRVLDQTVQWRLSKISVFGIALPVSLCKGVRAEESVRHGHYYFDVQAKLPWIGMLVCYRGVLLPMPI